MDLARKPLSRSGRLAHYLPLWVLAAVGAGVAILVYVAFLFALNASSDPVSERIALLGRDSVPLETRASLPVINTVTLSDILHDDPQVSSWRISLSTVLEQTAIPIPLKERRFGIRTGAVADVSLLDQAKFVLAVGASMPIAELQARFPSQVKVGSPNTIRDLVNSALPGITIEPLGAAPRQIPFHAGNTYFELDPSSSYWGAVRDEGTFAIQIGGEFPDLQLEFWAIRG